jgi:hypothetical protein
MTMAQARISETVDQFYDETAPMATAGRKYKDSMTTMDANARTQLVCYSNGFLWKENNALISGHYRTAITAQQSLIRLGNSLACFPILTRP